MERLLIAFPGQEKRTEEEGISQVPEHPLLKRILNPYDRLKRTIKTLKTTILFGNSFGTYAALVASGALSRENALMLAGERGNIVRRSEDRAEQQMYEALLREEDTTFMGRTGMLRLIGVPLEQRESLQRTYQLNLSNDYGAAVVLTGYKNVLELAAQKVGAKATILDVEAYHSLLRAKDAQEFAPLVAQTPVNRPNRIVISSTNPRVLETEEDVREELVGMMVRPVIFSEILNLLIKLGASKYLDLDPKASFQKLSDRFDQAKEKLHSLASGGSPALS